MKALIELGIKWLKDKLVTKGVEVASDAIAKTLKETVEERSKEGLEKVRDKVTESVKGLEGTYNRLTEEFSSKKEKEETNKFAEALSVKVSEDTKAIFDVKLYDTLDEVEYDKQIAVIHHISKGKDGLFIEIESIEERERSNKNHREERNLVDNTEHELAQAIKVYYEMSGIVCKEIFHLHVPKTSIQTTKQ